MLIDVKAPSLKRLDIPHEPGQWIEIRRLPWSDIPAGGGAHATIAGLFKAAITAWSYALAPDATITLDDKTAKRAYQCLDDTTAEWLVGQINAWNHPTPTEQSVSDGTLPSIVS